MANNDDFIPERESDLPPWYANFAAKLPDYAGTLGLSGAQMTVLTADNGFVQAIFDLVEQRNQEGKELTQFKNTELYGPRGSVQPAVPEPGPEIVIDSRPVDLIGRTRDLVRQIKAAATYTPTIGQDLGIVAATPAPPPGDVKPTIRAASATGPFEVTVEWVKRGHDGVIVECARGSEATFTVLERDNRSPFVDDRAPLVAGQPEQRRYRLRYFDADVAVGLYSDVAAVVVGP